MKRKFYFKLMAALVFSAVPWASANCLFHRVDFIPSRQALAQMSLPLAMMSASPQIQILGPQKKRLAVCSSAVVSDQGDILTAGHCVESCLARNGVYEKSNGFDQVDTAKLAQAKCYISVDGQTVPVQVLAINKCVEREEVSNPQARAACPGISYALLKVDPSVLGSGSCYETSKQPAYMGEPLAGVGFPDRSYRDAFRSGAQDSRGGGQQYVSFGNALPPKAACYKKLDNGGGAVSFPQDPANDYMIEKAKQGDLIQTSVDFVYGNSGGALVDRSNGELVGLGSFFEVSLNDKYTECSGSSFFTSLPAIERDIQKQYPRLDLSREFRCKSRSFRNQTGLALGQSSSI